MVLFWHGQTFSTMFMYRVMSKIQYSFLLGPLNAQSAAYVLFLQELIAILEEDFIELDDLLCPLSGIN